MRIIAGKYKNLHFTGPKGHRTHPMSEKVRSALFSMLGDLTDLKVFDAYGGSGAIGFEAISRGAKFVQITEIDRRTQELIQKNIEDLGMDNILVAKANCVSWLKRNPDKKFNVIIADPPYDNVNRTALEYLATALSENGLFVLSHPGNIKPPKINLKLIDYKKYGDASLYFYRR